MITIFTPAYNRAYIITHLYESLLEQSCQDFEWLVIDDGSVDNTEELIKGFIADGKITIRYKKVPNGGKHRAINKALNLAKGDLFFIVDSDDYLPYNAVERIIYHAKSIITNKNFIGVCGLRTYPNNKKVGGGSDFGIIETDAVSIREKYHVKGDLAEVWKTDMLRNFPFPEFEGEKFVSEGLVWARTAPQYKLRYFYESIYICDYLDDGLTKFIRKHHRNSPKGSMLLYNEIITKRKSAIKTKLTAAINYWRYTINYKQDRDGELAPIWWSYLFYPIGYLFYKIDIKKEKK